MKCQQLLAATANFSSPVSCQAFQKPTTASVWALAVFHFLDGVVHLAVHDGFVFHFGPFHAFGQAPADAAAAAHFDEAVLRAGEKGVFSIHKFGVQHYVALLSGVTMRAS